MTVQTRSMPNGEAVAAILAATIGSFALGVFTFGAELSAGLKTALTLTTAVGPLGGKTVFAVVIWLVAWLGLHQMWKGQDKDLSQWLRVSWVLLALGFALTFPPIFTMFHAE